MNQDTAATATDEREEDMLCPSCLHPNIPEAPFCLRCDAPIGDCVTFGPLDRVRAERFIICKAVSSPDQTIQIAGLWFIFFPMASGALFTVWAMDPFAVFWFDPLESIIIILSGIGGALLPAAIIVRGTSNYLRLTKQSNQQKKE